MDKISKSVCNSKSHVIVYFDVGVLQMWLSITFLEQWASEPLESLSGWEGFAILLVFSDSTGPTCLKNKDMWVLNGPGKHDYNSLLTSCGRTSPSEPDTGEIWKMVEFLLTWPNLILVPSTYTFLTADMMSHLFGSPNHTSTSAGWAIATPLASSVLQSSAASLLLCPSPLM